MASAKPGNSLVALAIVVALGGCSDDDSGRVPVECKEGADEVRAALARAPARVELGGTALSDCLTRGADPADIQQVGAAYIGAATELAGEARLRASAPQTLQLGYLVGAVRRGAARTQGVHDELRRRVEQELNGVDTRSAQYRQGYAAGREGG